MNKMFLLLMLIPSALFAQNSICGINFGTSYEDALSLLDEQFGVSLQSEFEAAQKSLGVKVEVGEKFISYENKKYADFTWDAIYFHFQEINGISYLNGGMLVIDSNTLTDAEEKRDKIKEYMGKKYDIEDYVDEENGLKMYVGGFDPTDPNYCGFTIQVSESSDDNKGKYTTFLSFGPYEYDSKSASSIKPTSICGVKFGTNYNDAKKILEKHFETTISDLFENKESVIMDKMHAGYKWDLLVFSFQRNDNNSYLIEANFYKVSKTMAKAVNICEGLKNKMEGIYEIHVYSSGEDGLKEYHGMNPKDPNLPGFKINVFKTTKGEFGTVLSYKPFNQ